MYKPTAAKGMMANQVGKVAGLLTGWVALAISKWSTMGPKLPVVILPSNKAHTVW